MSPMTLRFPFPWVAGRREASAPHGIIEGPAAGTSRFLGVDLARGLAVFGMYAAHVGPDPSMGGTTGLVMELFHGRSSALFALLAGFGVVLITGRAAPRTGRTGRQAVAKVVIRALVLLVLGTLLTMSGTPVDVILAFYGLYFLLVLPLYRLDALTLSLVAAGSALILPQLRFVLMQMIGEPGLAWEAVLDLTLTGNYPAITWIPFVLAGMAIARLDLTRRAIRWRLTATGAALAVIGYGGSLLALYLVPGAMDAIRHSLEDPHAAQLWWSDRAGYPLDDVPQWLWVASPHSETTLSILGNSGIAMLVLGLSLIAVGSISLSAYVFHIVGIGLLGIEEVPGPPLHVLFGFIVTVSVFAVLWLRVYAKGPLEALMGRAADLARNVP